MEKRATIQKKAIKKLELFRHQQCQAAAEDHEARKKEYRELQSILSPFWAWRTKSISG